MFVLNWTNLKDGLQSRIESWRTKSKLEGTTTDNTSGDNETTARAMSDDQTGLSAMGTSAGRAPNTELAAKIPAIKPDGTTVVSATKPVPPPYKLDASPVAGAIPVSSRIGQRDAGDGASKNHSGIDIAVSSGTPVRAVNAGRVEVAGTVTGFGNAVYIKHDDGFKTIYGHLSQISVKPNARVKAGDVIGLSGGAKSDPGHGTSTGAHLHYEMRDAKGNVYKDTLSSLDKSGVVKVLPSSQDKIASAVIPTPKQDTPNIVKPDSPVPGKTISADDATAQAIELRRLEVSSKFGSHVWSLTDSNKSAMINRITASGYNDTKKPNSFVAPYPTTTSVAVEIMGIAGISISDGFFVDRIPLTFEKHGVFQVTEVSDEVTTRGWRTKIRGYFKMMWYDANGSRSIT
jgi:murein DD-endopeptidase MepM/ murein hydrolase activator NlpD